MISPVADEHIPKNPLFPVQPTVFCQSAPEFVDTYIPNAVPLYTEIPRTLPSWFDAVPKKSALADSGRTGKDSVVVGVGVNVGVGVGVFVGVGVGVGVAEESGKLKFIFSGGDLIKL
jgi:hypothetical protein